MYSRDLLSLRDQYTRQRIMLCFNGPISRSLLEEIGNALRGYMEAEQATPNEAMDVFAVYIEMTQNIRRYTAQRGYNEQTATATVAIGRGAADGYVVFAGNVVERDDGLRLMRTIDAIGRLDPADLKAAYRAQLRRPRERAPGGGAGLGLLGIARKSRVPLQPSLADQPDGRAFFSLRAVI